MLASLSDSLSKEFLRSFKSDTILEGRDTSDKRDSRSFIFSRSEDRLLVYSTTFDSRVFIQKGQTNG